MKQPSVYIYSDSYDRFYDIPYDAEKDTLITPCRINTGIDFRANREALKQMTPNAYVLYMALITRPVHKIWIMSKLKLTSETALTSETLAAAFDELVQLGYLTPSNSKEFSHLYNLWESPALNPERH